MILQLRGLAGALSALHNYSDKGSYRHGDIKPENILRFDDGTAVGILKLTDMGLAKHHTLATQLRAPTTMRYGTARYEPPEVAAFESQSDARSRLYDVWSLGCICLELMIWLLYGYEELLLFNKSIKGSMQEPTPYFMIGAGRKASLHPNVERCLDHISRDPECLGATAMKDLLHIIRKKMLVPVLPQNRPSGFGSVAIEYGDKHISSPQLGPTRATAQALCDSLDSIISKGRLYECYWYSGGARDNIRKPSYTPPTTMQDVASLKLLTPDLAVRKRLLFEDYQRPRLELPAVSAPIVPKSANEILTQDALRFRRFLKLFPGGRAPCLLTYRASVPQTSWTSSGHLATTNLGECLVPDWFVRLFHDDNATPAWPDGVVVKRDGNGDDSYWCLNSNFEDSSASSPN